MTRKQRRGIMIGGGVLVLTAAGLLVLSALRDTIVFFHTPSEVQASKVQPGQRFRLGGLVLEGSIRRGAGTDVGFVITDRIATTEVTYRGVLPDLFREGQGVVVEGRLEQSGLFRAETVLAKHDENYMPPEVAKALKEQGLWQLDGKAGANDAAKSGAAEKVKGRASP